MPFIEVPGTSGDNVQLHYEDYGSGRPVVLIHGWPLSARSWEAQVPALIDAGYRVVAYDRRGFGQSSQPWDGYDYDTFAADLDALLSQLDLRDATLVGFSMGGGEVARYLGTYGGDRVSGAVFAAAVPPYLYKSDDNPDGGLDDATIAQFEGGVKGDRPAFLKGFVDMFLAAGDKKDLVSPEQHDYVLSLAYPASPKGTLDCIAAFGRTDFRDDLAKITVPTLVIHGDSDGVVPFEVSGKRTHDAIDGSTLVLIEGGPHGINASHVEQFNSALIDFLGHASGGSTTGSGAAAGGATTASASTAAAGATAAATTESGGRHEATETDATDVAPATFLEDPDEQAPVQPADGPAASAPAPAATDASTTAPAATDASTTAPAATDASTTAPAPAAAPTSESTTGSTSESTSESTAESTSESTAESTGWTPPAPSEAGDDLAAKALDSGFVWSTNEDDGVVSDEKPEDKLAVREGRVADPNLGDIPVDEQPNRI